VQIADGTENGVLTMPRPARPDDDKPLSIEHAKGRIANATSDRLAANDPGPVILRLKLTKSPDETYPLKLTQQQRESLILCTRIKNKLKER
jgi:hypothetical protein